MFVKKNASDQRFYNPLSMTVSQNIALISRCDLGCQANTCTSCKVLQASHQYGQSHPIQTLLDSSRLKKLNKKMKSWILLLDILRGKLSGMTRAPRT